jgi:hypothetical protein
MSKILSRRPLRFRRKGRSTESTGSIVQMYSYQTLCTQQNQNRKSILTRGRKQKHHTGLPRQKKKKVINP